MRRFYEAPSFPVIANAGLKNWLEQESTMLILKLSKVERTEQRAGRYVDGGDEADTATGTQTVEHTRLAYVVADKIRNIQPRRSGAGARLTFDDGGGYAVQESPEEILGFLGADVRGRSADVVQLAAATEAPPTPTTVRRSRRAAAEAEVQNIEGSQD
jgi:hypothetical protein